MFAKYVYDIQNVLDSLVPFTKRLHIHQIGSPNLVNSIDYDTASNKVSSNRLMQFICQLL